MIKNLLPIFFLLLSYVSVLAQDTKPPKVVFGVVSEEDLTMTVYEKDSSADAVVLYDYQSISLLKPIKREQELTYIKHKRIKILKRSAFELATIEIPIYDRFKTNIRGITAHTINWENGKKVITPVKADAFFEEELKEDIRVKRFTFPNIKEGSIIEYQCEFTDESTFQFFHDFQDNIPVRWSEVELLFPNTWHCLFNLNGTKLPITINKRYNETIGRLLFETECIRYHFAIQNIPALVDEPYVANMENYRARLNGYLGGRGYKLTVNYINYRNWQDLFKAYIVNHKDILDKEKYYKAAYKATKNIIESNIPQKDRMIQLYNHINKTMIWDEDYYIYPTELGFNKVYNEKRGNSADINLLLIALLKKAGLEAYPVLISTRNNRQFFFDMPYIHQFNHVIILVKLDDKLYYLDAIHADYPYNVLEFNNLTPNVYWMYDIEARQLQLPKYKTKSAIQADVKLKANGVIDGTFKIVLEGYSAIRFRKKIKENTESEVPNLSPQEEDEEVFETDEISNYVSENLEEREKRLKLKFDIETNNLTESTEDLIYFSPVWLTQFKENPFWAEERKYPVDLGYKIEELYLLKLKIPEGYEVESLPKAAKLDLLGKAGQFMFAVEQKDESTISVISRLELNEPVIQAEYYTYLKQFFELIAEKQNEQIVLKKVTKE